MFGKYQCIGIDDGCDVGQDDGGMVVFQVVFFGGQFLKQVVGDENVEIVIQFEDEGCNDDVDEVEFYVEQFGNFQDLDLVEYYWKEGEDGQFYVFVNDEQGQENDQGRDNEQQVQVVLNRIQQLCSEIGDIEYKYVGVCCYIGFEVVNGGMFQYYIGNYGLFVVVLGDYVVEFCGF